MEAWETEVLTKATQQVSSSFHSGENTRILNPILHFLEQEEEASRGVMTKPVQGSWGDHKSCPPLPGPVLFSLPMGSQVVPASAQAAPLASLIPGEGGG